MSEPEKRLNPFDRGRSRDEILADMTAHAGEDYPLFGYVAELEAWWKHRVTPAPRSEPDERFVRLATAVMQLRAFLALHRKATGRSDVNIRKVLALLDDALSDAPVPREESTNG